MEEKLKAASASASPLQQNKNSLPNYLFHMMENENRVPVFLLRAVPALNVWRRSILNASEPI